MEHSFSTWQARFWPVAPEESRKTLQVCLFKALISSVYCIFISTKDAVVVTVPGGKAEVLPVIKGILVPIISITFVILYTIGCNRFRPITLFKAIMAFFFAVLFLYGFVLLPHADFFTPRASAHRLLTYLGPQHAHWVAVYRNWIHTLYYLTAELWSQAVIFVSFWELANRLYTVEQAKRSYNLFITGGSLGNLCTAPLLTLLLHKLHAPLAVKMQVIVTYIALIAGLCVYLYGRIDTIAPIAKAPKKTKPKVSFGESVRYLAHSRYLLAITVTVLAVGMSITLVEVTWKANLKLLLGNNSEAMMLFMAKVNFCLNAITLFTVFLFSGNLLRRKGWLFSAQLTPLVVGITGISFFFVSKYKVQLGPFAALFHCTPLQLAAYAGAAQSIASKISKYAFYDITKEISYIPLAPSTKAKAKAAIDAVGSRLGKSGSSAIHLSALLLMSTSSALDITHLLIPTLGMVVASWLLATRYIAHRLPASARQAAVTQEP